jgi:hypothetical protein
VSVPSSPDLYSMVPPEALGTILVGAFGFGRVVHAVLSVGWAGFGVICGSQLLIFLPLGFVWSEIARTRAWDALPCSSGRAWCGTHRSTCHCFPSSVDFSLAREP